MNRKAISLFLAVVLFAASPVHAKLTPEQVRQLPPPTARPVDFRQDIQPIIEVSCTQCHGRGKAKGSLSMETREAFLQGGDSGPAAIPGNSAGSYVIATLSGFDDDTVMPKKGKKLTAEQVSLFRAWIDQGMPWPKEINFARHEPANLKPRQPAVPPARTGLENPVDRFLDAYFTKNKVKWGRPVDDPTFARRVWLDTIGLLPPPAELESFLADKSPNKRAKLVERLLSDNRHYAEHWLTFWNDLLRNDYRGTGYIDGGRKQITGWLYHALARNLPYDQFVAQLVDPTPEAEGFTKGIVWRGAVNASMVPPMQAAQSISQVFLGVNLKCASCHDSFINEYTLQDSYGMASVFADGPLELVHCDKPTGEAAKVKFLYPELGTIDANADQRARRKQLANLLTGRQDGRLPRAIVNRFWQRFLGRGLVESVDEMDKPAWSPDLLDWLAEDLVAHRHDLKHTLAQILTSRAYQLPAVNLGETAENDVFRGPAVRRISAEQFCDAIMALAGLDYRKADAPVNRMASLGGDGATKLPLQPKWIWSTPGADVKARPAAVSFRRVFQLAEAPTEACVTIAVDNNFTLTINGKRASAGKNSISPEFFDVRPLLKPGQNVIAVAAVNLQPNGRNPVASELTPASDNPAGVMVYARIRVRDQVRDLVSDGAWEYLAGGKEWAKAVELGGADMAPWKLGQKFMATAAARKDTLPVRASLVAADPLMVALGRPNREQVVTVRQSTATTLQALELTNGGTLAGLLKQAAGELMKDKPAAGQDLAETLFLKAVSRKPTAAERKIAGQLIGAPPKAEGVEDLLWSLAMLPEFQLIY